MYIDRLRVLRGAIALALAALARRLAWASAAAVAASGGTFGFVWSVSQRYD